MKRIRFRQRANRYGFTINNPFISESTKVLDPDKLTDEQKELLQENRNDFSHLKTKEFEKFFDFVLVEYFVNEIKDHPETARKIVAERIFFKSYDIAKEYFQMFDYIDYYCLQYELGESGNKHLQGFLHFERPMDIGVVHDIYPTMHLQKCSGKNSDCRDYCRKEETKIDGYDFFEFGVIPADERQRTDIHGFKNRILENATTLELLDEYPHLMLTSFNKVDAIRQKILQERYEDTVRSLHTTYIYGKADSGKTTYPTRVLGHRPREICKIADYGSGKFDEYNAQDIILFDEFDGQIPITKMNDYLDGQPMSLPARYNNKTACYTKAFVVSNYPLNEQYKKERADGKQPSFDGFVRRIHEIIYIPERNHYIWQKGQPTPETIAKLDEQKAKYEIQSTAEQITMGVK